MQGHAQRFLSNPKTPRSTCFSIDCPWRDVRNLPTAASPPPAAAAAALCCSFGVGLRPAPAGGACAGYGAARRGHACREQLARALVVDTRAVLRVERRRLRRAVDVVGRAHARARRTSRVCTTGVGHARLREDRDRGLADAHQVSSVSEVVERRLRVRLDRRAQRLRVVGRERAQRVLDAVAELGEHVRGDVLRRLRDEEHADALRADQPHGLRRPSRGTPSSPRRTGGAPRRRRRRASACRGRRPRAAPRTARRAAT